MTDLKWNNAALMRFCELMEIEYIDEALKIIAQEVGSMGTSGRGSVKGARVRATMCDAVTGNDDGIEHIMNTESVKALIGSFIQSMPRPQKKKSETMKEKLKSPLASTSDSDAGT